MRRANAMKKLMKMIHSKRCRIHIRTVEIVYKHSEINQHRMFALQYKRITHIYIGRIILRLIIIARAVTSRYYKTDYQQITQNNLINSHNCLFLNVQMKNGLQISKKKLTLPNTDLYQKSENRNLESLRYKQEN